MVFLSTFFTCQRGPESVVITRGKGKWKEVEEGKGGINGVGGRLDLGW